MLIDNTQAIKALYKKYNLRPGDNDDRLIYDLCKLWGVLYDDGPKFTKSSEIIYEHGPFKFSIQYARTSKGIWLTGHDYSTNESYSGSPITIYHKIGYYSKDQARREKSKQVINALVNDHHSPLSKRYTTGKKKMIAGIRKKIGRHQTTLF